jgi:UDP-N-acetylmuramyl pentapeptide phosphotransferase/UDP-N-acetylglucosamine-1-phosphate transferase
MTKNGSSTDNLITLDCAPTDAPDLSRSRPVTLPGLSFSRYKRKHHQTTEAAILIWTLVILVAGTTLASAVMVWVVRGQLLRHEILDTPNARSSHDVPTPRGGGIGVMSILLPVWVVIAFALTSEPGLTARWVIPLAAIALASVSWIDDLRNLGTLPRLGVQVIAVIAGALMLPGPVFQGLLPHWLDTAILVLGWIWFVNLFNFMDGIDGISGVEAIGTGSGVALIGFLVIGTHIPLAWHGLVIAGAAAGFLVWNWHPARIFLGDIGSIPLGYLLGWLLLVLAASGYLQAAIILPLYYLADATFTLLRRLLRGEKIWHAHREHFYQQAVRNGRSHAQVSLAVGATNIALIALAMLSTTLATQALWSWFVVLAAGALVTMLLLWMKRPTSPGNLPE